MAQQLELKAQARVRLDLVVVGAEKEIITSYKYKVMLYDTKHGTVSIDLYRLIRYRVKLPPLKSNLCKRCFQMCY